MKREKEKAKKQAKELVESFYSTYNAELLGLTHARKDAERNAIIAVKEIIKALAPVAEFRAQYWVLVREELQNL